MSIIVRTLISLRALADRFSPTNRPSASGQSCTRTGSDVTSRVISSLNGGSLKRSARWTTTFGQRDQAKRLRRRSSYRKDRSASAERRRDSTAKDSLRRLGTRRLANPASDPARDSATAEVDLLLLQARFGAGVDATGALHAASRPKRTLHVHVSQLQSDSIQRGLQSESARTRKTSERDIVEARHGRIEADDI